MANFAVLSGDIVSNVIVANTLADAEIATRSVCIEIPEGSNAGIGDTYDAKTGKFIPPTPAS
jgi:hypothetical protein